MRILARLVLGMLPAVTCQVGIRHIPYIYLYIIYIYIYVHMYIHNAYIYIYAAHSLLIHARAEPGRAGLGRAFRPDRAIWASWLGWAINQTINLKMDKLCLLLSLGK